MTTEIGVLDSFAGIEARGAKTSSSGEPIKVAKLDMPAIGMALIALSFDAIVNGKAFTALATFLAMSWTRRYGLAGLRERFCSV